MEHVVAHGVVPVPQPDRVAPADPPPRPSAVVRLPPMSQGSVQVPPGGATHGPSARTGPAKSTQAEPPAARPRYRRRARDARRLDVET